MVTEKPHTPTASAAKASDAPPPSRGRTRARALRNNATEAERSLWFDLREMKEIGHYFRRQVPIGKYIADFACHKAKLIVEVDGGHHSDDDQRTHDIKRDAWLEGQGYKVLRFWNSDVFKHRNSVVDTIIAALPLEGGGGREATGGGDPAREGKRS